jgi:hypothetical protein
MRSITIFLLLAASLIGAPQTYKETTWDDLVPVWWQPEKIFDDMNISSLDDDDPRVKKAMEIFMKEWQKSPVNREIDGLRIKLPGYVAPLDWEDETKLSEFLLVPYFGACIHAPPPPPNQIVHIKTKKPIKDILSMDTVWVYGVIRVETSDSGSMGVSGYGMIVDKVELYTEQ